MRALASLFRRITGRTPQPEPVPEPQPAMPPRPAPRPGPRPTEPAAREPRSPVTEALLAHSAARRSAPMPCLNRSRPSPAGTDVSITPYVPLPSFPVYDAAGTYPTDTPSSCSPPPEASPSHASCYDSSSSYDSGSGGYGE